MNKYSPHYELTIRSERPYDTHSARQVARYALNGFGTDESRQVQAEEAAAELVGQEIKITAINLRLMRIPEIKQTMERIVFQAQDYIAHGPIALDNGLIAMPIDKRIDNGPL